jgi:hypothetical protein
LICEPPAAWELPPPPPKLLYGPLLLERG